MIYSEGQIKVEVPDSLKLTKKNEVFLNENKNLDRDLHVLLIKSLGWKDKSFLDLMGASGIRSLRLAKETKAFNKIVINDFKREAYENMVLNAKQNKVSAEFCNKSAEELLFHLNESFDNIDIDPFGSPIYWVRMASQHVTEGGILSITATDTGALSGSFPEACMRRYHSKSYLSEFYYEAGIRILAKAAIEEASVFDYALTPIFCHAIGHYFRIYFKREHGAKKADKLLEQTKMLSYCPKCLHRTISFDKICPNCKERTTLIGPLFTGKMFDTELLKKMLEQKSEYQELLLSMIDENKLITPWFYTTDRVSKIYKFIEPKRSLLPYAKTHIDPKGFKTEVSISKIVEQFKSLAKKN